MSIADDTMNLWQEIREAANGTIIGMVIGDGEDRDLAMPDEIKGKLLTPEQAQPLLDYEYYAGYGGVSCHPIYAWTSDRVLFVSVYDGSSHVAWLPRNPRAIEPDFFGGG